MSISKTNTSQIPLCHKHSFDAEATMHFLAGAAIILLPEVLSKFIEFTDNIMKNGYNLQIKAGCLDFALRKS